MTFHEVGFVLEQTLLVIKSATIFTFTLDDMNFVVVFFACLTVVKRTIIVADTALIRSILTVVA